jgi:hypothetical protein
MAAVTVTFDGVRINDAEDNSVWASLGAGGAGPQNEPDFFYQGTQGVSRKIGTTIGGQSFDYSGTGSVDMTSADRQLWMAKLNATNKDILLANGSPAMEIRVGSSSSDYYQYDVYGNDDYPILGGWVLFALNPNLADYRSGSSGTPALTAVDWLGFQCDFSGTSKSENVVIDALDLGIGLCLVGGDSTDPDGVFKDFLDDDEGDVTNGRFGFFYEQNGSYIVQGMHWIGRNDSGTAVATEFTDPGTSLIFPSCLCGDGYSGLSFDLSNASTVISIDRALISGLGGHSWAYFDTRTEANGGYIDDTTDEIRFPEAHGFFQGDYVQYDKGDNNTAAIGLTDTNKYWVRVVSETAITLHTVSRRDALANTNRANLTGTAAGTADGHWLTRVTNNGMQLIYSGTSGDAEIKNSVINDISKMTLTSPVQIENCIINNLRNGDQGGGRFVESTLNLNNMKPGEGALIVDDGFYIDRNTFDTTAGSTTAVDSKWGHCIEVDTTGTVNMTGNIFERAVGTNNEGGYLDFNTETEVDGTNDYLFIATRPDFHETGEPIYYNKEGGTESIGLTEGDLYWGRTIGTSSFAFYKSKFDALADQNRINLTASTAGNGETHRIYSGNATILNSSGGAVNLILQQFVGVGTLNPTWRNTSGGSVSLAVGVTIIVYLEDLNGDPIFGAVVRIENASTGALLTEGKSANITGSDAGFKDAAFVYTSDLNVTVKVRAGGDASSVDKGLATTEYIQAYLPINASGRITALGMELFFRMTDDTINQKTRLAAPWGDVLNVGGRDQGNVKNNGSHAAIIPAGTDRKLIWWGIDWDDTQNTNNWGLGDLDGSSFTEILDTYSAVDGGTYLHIRLCYVDISDATDFGLNEGELDRGQSGGTGNPSELSGFIYLEGVATGAPESSDSDFGRASTGNPSLDLNNTTANSYSIGFFVTDEKDTTPVAAGTEEIILSDYLASGEIAAGHRTYAPGFRLTVAIEDRTGTGAHTSAITISGSSKHWAAAGCTVPKV